MATLVSEVSVIVVAGTDMRRFTRTMRSITHQTLAGLQILVMCDRDAPQVIEVARQAALQDRRIVVMVDARHHVDECTSINDGLSVATGEWVMFSRAGDELEVHACKNAVIAGESNQVEVVCGVLQRRIDGTAKLTRTPRSVNWLQSIHEREILDTIRRRPEFLDDHALTNKAFRRSLLERHDILLSPGAPDPDAEFVTEALVRARGIAVLPEVFAIRVVDHLDETHGPKRRDVRQLASRLESRVRIDESVSTVLTDEQMQMRTARFLGREVYRQLSAILDIDDITAWQTIAVLRQYLLGVNLHSAAQVRPFLRVAIYHVLVDDLPGVRAAMRFIQWSAVVDGTIVVDGQAQIWGCEHHIDGPEVAGLSNRWWLDVTEHDLATIEFPHRRLCPILAEIPGSQPKAAVHGTIANYRESLAGATSARLEAVDGAGRVRARALVTLSQGDPLRWTWRAARFRRVRSRWRFGSVGTLRLTIAGPAGSNCSQLRSSDLRIGTTLPIRLGIARTEGLHLHADDDGTVGFKLIRRSALSLMSAGIQRAWRAVPGVAALGRARSRWSQVTFPRWIGRIAARLPATNAYVFSSQEGSRIDGHPRYISELLGATAPSARQYWICHPGLTPPDGAGALRPGSWRYRWVMSRARAWVDDVGIDRTVHKHRHNRYVQTWHGIAFKRVGSDEPDWSMLPGPVRWARHAGAGRWDAMVSPSPFFARTTAVAVGFTGDTWILGTPLGDAVAAIAQQDAKVALGLDVDKPTVLYAPTSRPDSMEQVSVQLELWWHEMSGDCALLVRAHPDAPIAVSPRWANSITDVSAVDDWALLLAAADVLVTDYSAVTFDFARTGRPITFFAPDLVDFTRRFVGTYVPIEQWPGPICSTQKELHDSVRAQLNNPGLWAARVSEFAECYSGPADGLGAARVLRWLTEQR